MLNISLQTYIYIQIIAFFINICPDYTMTADIKNIHKKFESVPAILMR